MCVCVCVCGVSKSESASDHTLMTTWITHQPLLRMELETARVVRVPPHLEVVVDTDLQVDNHIDKLAKVRHRQENLFFLLDTTGLC